MTETKNYGLHLTVDGYNGSPDKLADVNRMYQFLNELPALIGMHKVGFPHIIQFTEKDIAGISGFQFIMESHISMHTYSNRNVFILLFVSHLICYLFGLCLCSNPKEPRACTGTLCTPSCGHITLVSE